VCAASIQNTIESRPRSRCQPGIYAEPRLQLEVLSCDDRLPWAFDIDARVVAWRRIRATETRQRHVGGTPELDGVSRTDAR
jgi:hypothetical protein